MFEGMGRLFRVEGGKVVQSLRGKPATGQGTGARASGSTDKRRDMGGRVPITVGESRYLRADILDRTRRWI